MKVIFDKFCLVLRLTLGLTLNLGNFTINFQKKKSAHLCSDVYLNTHLSNVETSIFEMRERRRSRRAKKRRRSRRAKHGVAERRRSNEVAPRMARRARAVGFGASRLQRGFASSSWSGFGASRLQRGFASPLWLSGPGGR